jgi:hypothetical protein
MRSFKRILTLLFALVAFVTAWRSMQPPRVARSSVDVTVELTTGMSERFELFYDSLAQGFGGQWSVPAEVKPAIGTQKVVFQLPAMHTLHGLRLDPGDRPKTFTISSVRIDGPYRSITWTRNDLQRLFTQLHHIDTLHQEARGHGLLVDCTGPDPFMAACNLATELGPVLQQQRPVLLPIVLAVLCAILAAWITHLLLALELPPLNRTSHRDHVPWHAYVLIVLSGMAIFFMARTLLDGIRIKEHNVSVIVAATIHTDDNTQLFHAAIPGNFTKDNFIARPVTGDRHTQLLSYTLPTASDLHYLRFDPGMNQDTVRLDSITLLVDDQLHTFRADTLQKLLEPNGHIRSMQLVGDQVEIITQGNDPYVILNNDLWAELKPMHARSGNGPIPTIIALIAALFFMLGSASRFIALSRSKGLATTDVVLVCTFAVVISAPLIVSITDTEPVLANTEKRLLAAKPTYTLARTLAYPTEYTRYYEENFGLRKLYFRWNSLFMSKVLRTSPLPDKVIFGKDGWMFYMQPGAMLKYEGICDLPPERLEQVAIRLEQRRLWLAAQGIQYVLMVPPSTPTSFRTASSTLMNPAAWII